MRGIIGAILFPLVLVGGMIYYLLFGEKTLEPAIHTDLTPEKLRALLADVYSFGAHSAEAHIASVEGAGHVVVRKVIQRRDDVDLCWVIPADLSVTQVERVRSLLLPHPNAKDAQVVLLDDGARVMSCSRSVDTATSLVSIVLREVYGVGLEVCTFRAFGISLNARTGWSST